jgi:hypothetical protein
MNCAGLTRLGHTPGVTQRKPLPLQLQGTPFRVALARELGVPYSRLRAGDMDAPFHGIRKAETSRATPALASSFAVLMDEDEYFSHVTAAELLGLRMPQRRLPSGLHVTSVSRPRGHRGYGIIPHHAATSAPTVMAIGVRVSSPIATWCDLATTLGYLDLVAMGDGLVCRKGAVATVARLTLAIEQMQGRRGAKLMRTVLEGVRPNTDSYKETELRLAVVAAGFPEPETNGEIRDDSGRVVAHGDLVFRDLRVILEYDGPQHREDERQYRIDIARLDHLVELKWRVIRVDKYLLRDRPHLFAKVDKALRAGGWTKRPRETTHIAS